MERLILIFEIIGTISFALTGAAEKELCDAAEKEMEKDAEYAQRRELVEDISSIDRIYASCTSVTSSDRKELESIASSLTVMQKDFFDFGKRMQEMRQARKRDSCSHPVSPVSSGGMERADSQPVHVKGWTCSVCGIVNDNSKVICDGCFQRHICVCLWEQREFSYLSMNWKAPVVNELSAHATAVRLL